MSLSASVGVSDRVRCLKRLGNPRRRNWDRVKCWREVVVGAAKRAG